MSSRLTLSSQLVSLKCANASAPQDLKKINKKKVVIVYLAAMLPNPQCLSVKRENITDDFIHSQQLKLFIQAPLNVTIHEMYY